MKKTFYILFMAVFTLVVTPEIIAQNKVILSGVITNTKDNILKISSLHNSFSKKITINEDGTFAGTLNIDADHLMIYDGSYVTYLYVEPGNDLKISYDAKDYYKTMVFKGIGAEVNTYLFAKRMKERAIIGKDINVYELNETDYLAKQKEIKSNLLELLSKTENLSKKYIEKEKRNIAYTYLKNLNEYQEAHSYYTKIADFKVSKDFLKELDNFDYNRYDDFMFSYNYSSLVKSHCNIEAEKLSKKESIDQDVAYLLSVNTLSNQDIKNRLLYDKAIRGISFTSDLEGYYKAYMSGSTNVEHNKEITKIYNELIPVTKGKPSPKFINYDNAAGGATSLDELKGKYVYIDVWATWCGPCKAEIPHLKKVEEAYHGKNISFVSISLDVVKDREKWKKMVQDENLKGIQLLADNDFNSQFAKEYHIQGIPKFILLDPNGTIIDANAPRPSDEKLVKLFDQLKI